MKTYKNITYALLALSMMVFFTVGQASALMEPGDLSGFDTSYTNDVKLRVSQASDPKMSDPMDFSKGRNAGLEVGRESINSCAIGGNTVDLEANEARTAYLDKNMDKEKSSDFIAGFDSGFRDSASLYNYSYCKN